MEFGVKNTRREAPVRAVFYGRGGIGKSTLASQAPSTIFVCSEEGLENIDAVAVEPFPKTWEEALAALDYVGTLNHQTIAIDSLDWLEPLCWDYVVRKANSSKIKDIEGFGYGKGYVAALDQWRALIQKLSLLRAKGMNVILIAHGIRKLFKNPLGEDYEQWTIKLNEKAAGLIVEWVDVVGYCEQEVSTDEVSKDRHKALTTGKRIIRTNPDPAYLAKTRYALPRTIPLNWAAFAQAVHDGGPAVIATLKEAFEARIRELQNDEVEKGARAFLSARGISVPSLTEAIATLDSYLNERKKAS